MTQAHPSESTPTLDVECDFVALTASDDPYAFWQRARHEQPVFYNPENDVWIVTRHEDLVAVLKDYSRFSSHDAFTPMVPLPPEVKAVLDEDWSRTDLMRRNFVNLDPPAHTRIRRVLNRAMTRRVVEERDPMIRGIANELVDRFVQDGHVDVVTAFAYPFPAMVVFDIFGVPREDMPQYLKWGQQFAMLLGGTGPLDVLLDAAHGFVEFQRCWEEAFEERRQHPRDDLLTAFVEELDADPEVDLTTRELTITALGTSAAGHSTTAQTICFALLLLLEHRDQLGALQADPELMSNAIDEILRFEPPLQMLRRTTTVDVEVSGVTIPKGATVMLACASSNHDETHFSGDPDAFDICRPDAGGHLTFGKWAHFCPGAPLARREVAIALEVLLGRLPNLRLAGDRPFDRMKHFWHRGFVRLELEWDVVD